MNQQDYEYLGKELQDILDDLMRVWNRVEDTTAANALDEAIAKVDDMRNKLDNDYARDCPMSEWRSETFYRRSRRKRFGLS